MYMHQTAGLAHWYPERLARLTLVGGLLLMIPGVPAVAQDNRSVDTRVEEVIVTARRVGERILDAPITVNALTETDIKDAGVTQTADFVQLIPNVTLAESQTIGTSFLTVRGLSRVRNGELPVAVVVDGVLTINARQFIGQVFDVQQIEVVKGPQGAIYGRNASNGAIIITTKPPTAEPEGAVRISYGAAEEVGLDASWSGPVTEDLAVRVTGRLLERDGYFTNITLQDEVDPYSDRTLRMRAAWTPSDVTAIDFKAEVSKHEGKGIGFHWPGVALFGADLTGELGLTREQIVQGGANLVDVPYVANNPDRGVRETAGFSLKLDREFNAVNLKWVASFDELTASTVADQGPYLSTFSPLEKDSEGRLLLSGGEGTQHTYVDVQGWSQELRLTSPTDRAIRWQAGIYYLAWERQRTTAVGYDLGQGIKRPITIPEFENSTNPTKLAPGNFLAFLEDSTARAAFFSIDWDLAEQLTLTVAGRHDREQREQIANRYNTAGRVFRNLAAGETAPVPYATQLCDSSNPAHVAGTNCLPELTFDSLLAHTELAQGSQTITYELFQPKATLAYKLSDNINLYSSWGVGYRAGQYNYPGVGDLSATAKAFIDQEENRTIEAGLKADYGNFRFNLAYFDSNVDNTQYFPFDGQAFVQVFEDVDEAELSGFEAELAWSPTSIADFYLAYGTTDAEITKYDERPTTVGNTLPYVPDKTFNTGVQVRFPVATGRTLFLRGDYELRGEQYWTPENVYPRDDVTLVNLRAGLEGEDWTLALYLNNATDEKYNSEVVTPLFLHPATPRAWRLSYSWEF